MASSASSGLSNSTRHHGAEKGKGIPRNCRCGGRAIIKTAVTVKNPGRLFYCCPYGSYEDNNHLFKWTDISMVEEMEDVEMVVEKLQVDMGTLEKGLHDLEAQMDTLAMETRTCEAVANSFDKKIASVKKVGVGCEKELAELKHMLHCCEKEVKELRWSKNMIVCVLLMLVLYWLYV